MKYETFYMNNMQPTWLRFSLRMYIRKLPRSLLVPARFVVKTGWDSVCESWSDLAETGPTLCDWGATGRDGECWVWHLHYTAVLRVFVKRVTIHKSNWGVGTRDFTLIWISIQIKCSPFSTLDVYISLAVPPASASNVNGHWVGYRCSRFFSAQSLCCG